LDISLFSTLRLWVSFLLAFSHPTRSLDSTLIIFLFSFLRIPSHRYRSRSGEGQAPRFLRSHRLHRLHGWCTFPLPSLTLDFSSFPSSSPPFFPSPSLTGRRQGCPRLDWWSRCPRCYCRCLWSPGLRARFVSSLHPLLPPFFSTRPLTSSPLFCFLPSPLLQLSNTSDLTELSSVSVCPPTETSRPTSSGPS